MNTLCRFAAAVVCVLPVTALEACGGRTDAPSQGGTGTAEQAVATVAPIYTVDWHTPYPNNRVWVLDAEVDDSDNTYVLGRIVACQDCPVDFYAYVFGEGGTFTTQFEVFSSPGGAQSVNKMRVNGTGFVAAGQAYYSQKNYVVVERFDASNAHRFEKLLPTAGGMGGVDLCNDGSTVVLNRVTPSTQVVSLDASGNVQWTTVLSGMSGQKVRCTGSDVIYVAGIAGGAASVARVEIDGTLTWTWTGADAASSATFDLGNDGNVDVATGDHVYSVTSDGDLAWSVAATQSLTGVCAADVVSVAGSTAAGDGGTEYYTGSDDETGTQVCSIGDSTMSGHAYGIALDDADDAFLCGTSGAALYGQDGATRWTYPAFVPSIRTDVTNGVARCIGTSATNGIGIVAFAVP